MNDVVYPLYGAYEDWAYYSGWNKKNLSKNCINWDNNKIEMKGLVFLI